MIAQDMGKENKIGREPLLILDEEGDDAVPEQPRCKT